MRIKLVKTVPDFTYFCGLTQEMEEFTDIASLRRYLHVQRLKKVKIGFVPTMGYLHEGHLSLVKLAKQNSDIVVTSIFVNPTQFNNQKDLASYPRDIERDRELLKKGGVDAIFLPTAESMYGPLHESKVELKTLSAKHEGEFRPGHFSGVTTVVAMLFNIVGPDLAVFGEKDFQQLRIIEKMVLDLKYDINILRAETIREKDGLALSSRNVRLNPETRKAACLIIKGLRAGKEAFSKGQTDPSLIKDIVLETLGTSAMLKPEYVSVVDEESLSDVAKVNSNSRILTAVWAGDVRLIDNLSLKM